MMLSKPDSISLYPELFSKTCTTLLTGALLPGGEHADIMYDEKGVILSIGPDIAREFRDQADLMFDMTGTIAIPGFVNTHTHAAMTLLRGYADDMHLQQWLSEKIWPLEAHLTGNDVYWGTKLACLEMIRSGTVALNDMYFFMDSAAKAVQESGLRAVLSHGIITFGNDEKFEVELKATENLVHHIRTLKTDLIKPAIGPHAPYTVPPAHLEKCAEYSRDEGIMLHIHLSETKQEVDDCIKAYGMSPAVLLDKTGCLTSRTVAAHGCWLSEDDCRLIGKRGAHIAHNPASNMKLATGRAMPYQWLKEAGVNVGLGTDGCSSNNNLDMLEEMKIAALCQKFFWNSDVLLPAGEAFSMATSCGAKALGYQGGELKPGMPADICFISLSSPSMVPLHNSVSNIVYSAEGGDVNTVICNGRFLMHDRYIPGEDQVIAGARKSSAELLERAANSG